MSPTGHRPGSTSTARRSALPRPRRGGLQLVAVLLVVASTSPRPVHGAGCAGQRNPGSDGHQQANEGAFVARRTADGSLASWGMASHGGSGTPSGSGYDPVVWSTATAFTARRTADGSLVSWGRPQVRGVRYPKRLGV